MLSAFEAQDTVERMTEDLRRFLSDKPVGSSLRRERRIVTLGGGEGFDFSPEAYLESGKSGIDVSARFLNADSAARLVRAKNYGSQTSVVDTVEVHVADIVEVVRAKLKTIKEYPQGTVPVVSATAANNGIGAWLDVPDGACEDHCITVSLLHNTKPCQAFWHPYRFGALTGKAMVLRPYSELLEEPDAIFYFCEAITANNAWRYHYARSVKLDELVVELPARHGTIDIKTMAAAVRSQMGAV